MKNTLCGKALDRVSAKYRKKNTLFDRALTRIRAKKEKNNLFLVEIWLR